MNRGGRARKRSASRGKLSIRSVQTVSFRRPEASYTDAGEERRRD
jgi:hypothetical protein